MTPNPLRDYVVCKAEEAESKTKSGLYIPGNAQEKPRIAKVLSVGKDVKELKVDDRIVYKTYSTTEIKSDGEEFILVKEEDVLATVKEDK